LIVRRVADEPWSSDPIECIVSNAASKFALGRSGDSVSA